MDIDRLQAMNLEHLKALPVEELPGLAEDIRQFLLRSVSTTGGHIGANLGTIELTIALHYVFASPREKILWDTGHQGYTQRILTGRAAQFASLNTYNGMSRFLQRGDSPHDPFDATHAGTALSTAIGLAAGLGYHAAPQTIIAVIGDGALGEGSTWEGLNYLASTTLPVLIVINDNGMAIPKTIGGITTLLASETQARQGFESLGFRYLGLHDGHDIPAVIAALTDIESSQLPAILHVKTEKGRGLACAKTHPYKMHFSVPFDVATGEGASPTTPGRTYATVASEALAKRMAVDEQVVVLTPGTPYASGLEPLMEQFPARALDVGMAEQHALSMACGLALAGCKPVVCYQSTFLQRAYDQVLHDLCGMHLPVTLLIARAGFAGYDGPTHHGLWDIPVLRSFPGMQICYPAHTRDLTATITRRLIQPNGPMAILYPYEAIPEPEALPSSNGGGLFLYADGLEGTMLCLANMAQTALAVRAQIQERYQRTFGVYVVAQVKPLSQLLNVIALPQRPIVTLEEGVLAGGFGSLIQEYLAGEGHDILALGTRDCFIPAGAKGECARAVGLDPTTITDTIAHRWGWFPGKGEY